MRTRLILCVLCAALLSAATAWTLPAAAAEKFPRDLGRTVKIPTAWAGIWSFTDSSFTCTNALKSVTTGLDTLCAGAVFLTSQYTCTGTANATSFSMTCTYTFAVFPDCQADISVTTNGTLTGDTYSAVTRTEITYSGTGTGCDLLPPSCTIIHEHATRTGPAPAEYCATATVPVTWGKIKEIYR